ncbi:peroxiredoxin-like family protein [Lutimonas sp.]|uniref:peroxiredoxin-like family protein n=1 Tax=Lutimonas sp. TaxID=1872403 RepID=UPI003D9BFD45
MKLLVSLFLTFSTGLLMGQIDNEHLKVGASAPRIIAKDQHGELIDSQEILKEHQLLLIFYRGNWCPHCQKHLNALQSHLQELKSKGVFVVVVSPESEARTKETSEMISSDFAIVHDKGNVIMNDYKVAFEVNKETVPTYYEKMNDLLATYNVDNSNVLPVPATYLISKAGKISYVHYDPDYKNRSDLAEVLEMVE